MRVNAIAPGLVKTDFARALWEPNEDAIARRCRCGGWASPRTSPTPPLFLASRRGQSWITGDTLVVDGGAPWSACDGETDGDTASPGRFGFEAAHQLPWHPGRCRDLHGHSYRLEVTVEGPIGEHGS